MLPESVEHNLDLVEKIVSAVLYEGYILYPYRSSSIKNRQRWNFGVLAPRSHSEANGDTDAWGMQTECLVRGDQHHAALDVRVRFLHLLAREIGVPIADCGLRNADWGGGENGISLSECDYQVVESLDVGSQRFQSWQEAVEREVSLTGVKLCDLVARPNRQPFAFESNRETEVLRDPDDQVVGLIVRRQGFIKGEVELTAEQVGSDLYKLTVRVLNLTPLDEGIRNPQSAIRNWRSRDEVLLGSLVSAHTVLGVRGGDGEFVSLLDPPEDCRIQAAACANAGTWPVLVGEEGARDLMLSSPIILYDYPQVAPESAGNLFDGMAIDEILTLRILTLTDEEKREMRGVDEHARRLLERTETLPPEQMMKLHGAMKSKR